MCAGCVCAHVPMCDLSMNVGIYLPCAHVDIVDNFGSHFSPFTTSSMDPTQVIGPTQQVFLTMEPSCRFCF